MNWEYNKHNWYISWYNVDNMPEDSYEKKYGIHHDIIENGGKPWRKIFNLRYRVKDYMQDGYMESEHVGLQYVNDYSTTSISWIGRYKIYRLYFRDADTCKDKGKWCLKFISWRNDHVCGG